MTTPTTPAALAASTRIRAPGQGDRLSVAGALVLARQHCNRVCFAYHASWRITRLLGLKGNPSWHEGFYRQALTQARITEHRQGRPVRVLICASADETMLAVLARVLTPNQGTADVPAAPAVSVHVVDACRTPLLLCATYAQRHALTVTTNQDTAPDLACVQGPFEVIVTDGLLSLLPDAAARSATLSRLSGLLTDDGALLYTTRITHAGRALEYDRLGRILQTLACLTWGRGHRLRLALSAWTRPARSSPFATRDDVQAAIGEHFTRTQSFERSTPPTLALRLHPNHWWPGRQQASACVGILATSPQRGRS
jgi:hypothetical protein